MDESRLLKAPARLKSRLFLFAAVLSACAPAEPKLTPTAPAASFSETVKSVSQTRSLPTNQEIKLAEVGASSAGATDLAPIEFYHGAPIAAAERVYKTVGLLPDANDFKKDLQELRRLESLFNYDRTTASVSWAPSAPQLGTPLARLYPERARDLAPVFAIMQALQEQHFFWRARIDNVSLEDRRAAFRAVAAGDAVLTLALRDMKENDSKFFPTVLYIADQISSEMDRLAAALPPFLRRQLSFPYRHGSRFAYWAFQSRGWPGVNALFLEPPLSTAQVLHPEKYFLERQSPLRFFPARLLRRFQESAVVEQSMGEDAMIGLLAGDRPAKTAENIAAAWRGDQLFAFPDSGDLTTVWLSSWRTETQAEVFLRAYRIALERRHRIRFVSEAASAPLIASRRDQRGWLLERKNAVVLLVSTAPASRLAELAADAWQDLEIEPETTEMRFESARIAGQIPPTKR